jgi:hypothetical protein
MSQIPSLTIDKAVKQVVDFFEKLSPESLVQLGEIYASQARFKDPFNAVTGLPAIEAIFRHMYVALEAPHFVVTEQIVQGKHCMLTWEFRFRFKRFQQGLDQVILGATHLEFSEEGKIVLHRDYWDAAEELYEKLPLVGGLMRWLKKRANS